MPNPIRRSLYDALHLAGREMSASIVMFHTVMAARYGLTVTDWRALDLVTRKGPFTAGEFARLTGFTPGAITGLVDRLEKAGVVERVRDPNDRRKILVRTTASPALTAERKNLFKPLTQAGEALFAGYSDDQLRTITDYMTRMSDILRKQTAALQTAEG